jgi:hypothetical protein
MSDTLYPLSTGSWPWPASTSNSMIEPMRTTSAGIAAFEGAVGPSGEC